jgi:hypothetical protein
VRREHVVDELVVALADRLPDPEEVAHPVRVALDLGHALVLVGHDVDPRELLERVRVDDVGRAVPVVADVEDVARSGRRGRRADGQHGDGRGQDPEKRAHGGANHTRAGMERNPIASWSA